MDAKEFDNGDITVFTKPPAFGGTFRRVGINWIAIGTVSVDRAREFHAALGEAIKFAESEEQSIRGEE